MVTPMRSIATVPKKKRKIGFDVLLLSTLKNRQNEVDKNSNSNDSTIRKWKNNAQKIDEAKARAQQSEGGSKLWVNTWATGPDIHLLCMDEQETLLSQGKIITTGPTELK